MDDPLCLVKWSERHDGKPGKLFPSPPSLAIASELATTGRVIECKGMTKTMCSRINDENTQITDCKPGLLPPLLFRPSHPSPPRFSQYSIFNIYPVVVAMVRATGTYLALHGLSWH